MLTGTGCAEIDWGDGRLPLTAIDVEAGMDDAEIEGFLAGTGGGGPDGSGAFMPLLPAASDICCVC